MKLKLLISTGAVIGLLAVSVAVTGKDFTHETEPAEPQKETIMVPETVSPIETILPPMETEHPQQETMIQSRDWDADESYLLEKIAMAEAENQDTEGKALVMCVVLNRTWSDEFPNSIEKVIYQKNQFSPISNGRFDEVEPDQDCQDALLMVEHGWDESRGALYFESESESTWHREHLRFLFQHGDHMFYTDKE